MYIGSINSKNCTTSTSAVNNSVLITGASGSGKTCRMQQIELKAAQSEAMVIVLDTSYSHVSDQIYAPIRTEYEKSANRLSVLDYGINLHLFDKFSSSDANQTKQINYITQIIASSAKLKSRQIQILRKAIASAYARYTEGMNEFQLIGESLESLGTDGENLYDNLWHLFQSEILQNANYTLEKGKINIIDLNDINNITQKIMIELILRNLWNTKGNDDANTEYIICLDECQNLYLGQDSIICQLLREGRKFHISLLLATQSLIPFSTGLRSMLEQTGTKLYFRPSQTDLRNIAQSIKKAYGTELQQCLAQLKIGESLVIGDIQINDKSIQRPIVLK